MACVKITQDALPTEYSLYIGCASPLRWGLHSSSALPCCKGRGDGRVHIPHDQDHLWPVVKQNWFDALHNFRSLHCVAAGTSFEIHIRFSAGLSPRRNCRREGRRSAVEVHQAVFDVVKVLQFFDDGSDFHEGWPCPNYAQKPNHRESPAVIRLRTIGSKGDWLKSMMEKY